jgi:molecular chaperone HscB
VVALPPDADHYQVFGISRRLGLDVEALAARYYELSRLLHPDRHGSGPAEARDASLRNQAALTRAYRALRDPMARARYWLELHGVRLGDDNRVPAALAARVFEVQEKVEDLRSSSGAEREERAAEVRSELEALRAESSGVRADIEALFAASDGGDAEAALPRLQQLVARFAYLATLVRDVEAALALEAGAES